MLPAVGLLLVGGYYLDAAVSFTAKISHVPEGVISFCVLSVMTSWPEFRTALSLLKLGKRRPAVMNILISNITNLWLAVIGAVLYLLLHAL
jgi:cation:H+ antiporter